MPEDTKDKEAAEVQKALDQRSEPLTAEQENVASDDVVEVYSKTDEETATETWHWKRVDTEGDIVSESTEDFTTDNFALANAANENPGLMAHVPDTPPIKEVEVEGTDA